jgi:hypothetical protein
VSRFPPRLTSTGFLLTNGAVGVDVTTAIVASPGAGLRIRLWAVEVIHRRAASGDAELRISDSTLVNVGGYLALSDEQRHARNTYPGGRVLVANRGVSIVHTSSVAGTEQLVAIYFGIEPV